MLLVVVKISDEHSELLRLPEGRRVFVLLVALVGLGSLPLRVHMPDVDRHVVGKLLLLARGARLLLA